MNLKYTFIDLPQTEEGLEETLKGRKKIQKDFDSFKKTLTKKLKLGLGKPLYLYLRDGTYLDNHYQIPRFERVVFAGHCVTFKGIDNIFCNQKQINLLKDIILELEDKI